MGIVTLNRGIFIIVLVSLIACLLLPAQSLARDEMRFELRTPDTVVGWDFYRSNSQQSLFHQQKANLSDKESLDIDFPLFTDIPEPTVLGPTTGAASVDGISLGDDATSNVVPFGLVDLAVPSISQESEQSYDVSSTGFYTSTFLGIPPQNTGSYPVTTGPAAFSSPVASPPMIAGPSMPFPELLNIMPGYERQKAINKSLAEKSKNATVNQTAPAAGNATANSTAARDNTILVNRSLFDLPLNGSVVKAQQAGISQTISGQRIAGAEPAVPINYTGRYAYDSRLSYPYFPFEAKADEISSMSMLDRMWRNSHLGTIGRAYEGDTSYPTWILPTEFTKSAISMYNWYDVNNMALAYTMPGMHLERRFWDLGLLTQYVPADDLVSGGTPEPGATIKPTTMPTPTPILNNTTLSGGNRSAVSAPTNTSIGDWITNSSAIKSQLNMSAPGNISRNITAGGTTIMPQAFSDITAPYIPAGGPAGKGVEWPWKGPHQIAWMGGPNNPWVMGPSNNPIYPGMGGPDWPPYYWGFGRYKGWS
jgi:hypothetical protein